MKISNEDRMMRIVRRNGRGWVFSAKDFSHIAPRQTIDMALHRLAVDGRIRRIGRGMYDFPEHSRLLNMELGPRSDRVAAAIARKFGWRIQVTGPVALNLIGLSNQVPGRAVFLSSGPNRSYSFGSLTIEFVHRLLKETDFQHDETAVVVAAIRSLGQNGITPAVKVKIRDWLNPAMRRRLVRDSAWVSGWIQNTVLDICRQD